MPRQSAGKRRNINFRQTHSERSATNSYRAFKNVILRQFKNVILRERSDRRIPKDPSLRSG